MPKILFFLAIFICGTLLAQEPWRSPNVLALRMSPGLEIIDFDGDGYEDILSSGTWQERLALDRFSAPKFIVEDANILEEITLERTIISDIDGDGDLDIVGDNQNLKWIENFGDGVFLLGGNITYNNPLVEGYEVVDLDNDGDFDAIYYSNSYITSRINEGDGTFTDGELISGNEVGSINNITCSDFDGDGDQDIIISSSTENKIFWFENLGDLMFNAPVILASSIGLNGDMLISDMNGDGNDDIVYCSFFGDNVKWFENLGSGNLSEQILLSEEVNDPNHLLAADLDNDGYLELLMSSNDSFQIFWFDNLGNDNFSTENVLTTTYEIASLKSLDCDGDGDLDVLAMTNEPSRTIWFENLGEGEFSEQRLLSSVGASEMAIEDLDGDGDQDVLTISDQSGKILWHENLENGDFKLREPIVTGEVNLELITVADFDGVGGFDIVATFDIENKIVWYQNMGGGLFSGEIVLSNELAGIESIHIADLDGDGDNDILTASKIDDKIAWFENLSNGAFSTPNVIANNIDFASDVFTSDLDLDGDLDVLSIGSDKVSWHQNYGFGNFSSPILVSNEINGGRKVLAFDIDGDGDFDVVSASEYDDKLAWYQNTGTVAFSEQRLFSHEVSRPKDAVLQDLDNDGDQDVVLTSLDNDVVWFENIGLGNFLAAEDFLGDTPSSNANLCFRDIDGDLMNDLVLNNGSVVYYKNRSISDGCTDPEACNFSPTAVDDNNSCCFGICGCTDENAFNFNPEAGCDIGDCDLKLSGLVFFDENENGIWDDNDLEFPLASQEISLAPIGLTTWTDNNGEFVFNVNSGDYQLELEDNTQFPFSTTMNTIPIQLSESMLDLRLGVSNQIPNFELSVEVYSATASYPCEQWVVHSVQFENEGNVPVNGIVELDYNPLFQDYLEISTIDSVIENKIYMSFDNLLPGQNFTRSVGFLTPTVEFIGEFIATSSQVYGYFEDELAANGSSEISVELTCAYDPNDKRVFPIGYEEPHFILPSTELQYVIRFQNTGNAAATDVLVTDTIDGNLDLESFSLVANSHEVQTIVRSDLRVIEFIFEDIMLPDSASNEMESHGMVSFVIKPNDNLIPETELNNTANIYFDNNPPIITNTTWNTIFDCSSNLLELTEPIPTVCEHEEVEIVHSSNYVEHYEWFQNEEVLSDSSSVVVTVSWLEPEIGLAVSNPICEVSGMIQLELFPTPIILVEGETDLCLGQLTTLSASGSENFQWTGYDSGETITVLPEENTYFEIVATNEFGCTQTNQVLVEVNPVPDIPDIIISSNILTSSVADGYQWYLNDNIIVGADEQVFEVTQNGIYKVEVINEWGCSEFSQEVTVNYVGLAESERKPSFIIFPNPSQGELRIEAPSKSGFLHIYDITGKLVKSVMFTENSFKVDLSTFSIGVYHFLVFSNDHPTISKRIFLVE